VPGLLRAELAVMILDAVAIKNTTTKSEYNPNQPSKKRQRIESPNLDEVLQ